MALLKHHQLDTSFAGVYTLEANGIAVSGSDSPAGIGNSLYIANGCMVSRLRDTDGQVGLGNRSEISEQPDAIGDERWFCYEWMASGWPIGRDFSISQLHDLPDAGDNPRVPNALTFYDGETLKFFLPQTALPGEGIYYNMVGCVPAEQGVWHTVVVHIKWSTSGGGFVDVVVDGYMIARRININTAYNDALGPFFKLGVYDYSHTGGFGERTAMFRNVRIFSGQEKWANIMGAAPMCRPMHVKI